MNDIGTKFERMVAADLGGRVRPGSGCLPFAKADVITPAVLVECKASNSGIVRVKAEWIKTIRTHAGNEKLAWALAACPTMRYTDDYWIFTEIPLVCDPLNGCFTYQHTGKSFPTSKGTMPDTDEVFVLSFSGLKVAVVHKTLFIAKHHEIITGVFR